MSIPDEEETGPQIVKTKQFAVKPMSAEEAVLQLELVGHDFFVFRSDESGEVNVIYRRRDGGYGLNIVASLASQWGISRNGGTRVWAELTWPEPDSLTATG